jgi:hypothetical protein
MVFYTAALSITEITAFALFYRCERIGATSEIAAHLFEDDDEDDFLLRGGSERPNW